jgi:hypothetical protein
MLWPDKLAPAVLRWIESGATDERVVLVRVEGGSGMQLVANSYASASHVAWLSMEQAAAADMGLWSTPQKTLSLLRAGGVTWELGLPYVHELQALVVRGSRDGIRQIAQLESVVAILDGAAAVPAPAFSTTTGLGPAEGSLTQPAALLSLTSASGNDLVAWMAELGWRFLAKQDVATSDDLDMPLRLAAAPLTVAAPSYDLVGLALRDLDRQAVEQAGASLATALLNATWVQPPDYALTAAGLAELLEAMEQTGADAVAIAPIGMVGQTRFLYILLRSATGGGWASLAAPGPGASTTRDALPRGAAPTEIAATLGSYTDRVFVQWQPVGGASSYEILRAETPGGAYDPIGVVTENSFADTDVQTCTQYSYVARSIADAGLGVESARAAGYVGRVPMPSARIWTNGDVSSGAIRVEWTPSDGATHYRLMRSQYMTGSKTVAAQQYGVAEVTDPVFLDTDVIVGQTYLYRVFSLNGCGRSEQSAQAKGMSSYAPFVPSSPLEPPAWVETTRGEPYDEVVVSWTAVRGTDSYVILRSLAYAGPYNEVARVTGTLWEDLDVVLCGDYWYRVQSVVGSVVGAPSAILYGSCGYRPGNPDRVRASRGTYSESIRIDWAEMDFADHYQISRAPTHDGPFATIAQPVMGLYYVDEGLSPGQEFWYKVRAVNDCGCSGDNGAVRGSTSGG